MHLFSIRIANYMVSLYIYKYSLNILQKDCYMYQVKIDKQLLRPSNVQIKHWGSILAPIRVVKV